MLVVPKNGVALKQVKREGEITGSDRGKAGCDLTAL